MKYNDNGTYKDIYVKTFDTLPVGTEVDYDGNTVPTGWTQVDNVVWENDSPTSSFASQDITLDDTYSKIEIIFTGVAGASQIIYIAYNDNNYMQAIGEADNKSIFRRYKLNGTTLWFDDGLIHNTYGAQGTVNNTYLIPIKVIGYK